MKETAHLQEKINAVFLDLASELRVRRSMARSSGVVVATALWEGG
jgi:hypothetical protein